MDRDRCLDVIAEAVCGHRQGLDVISRGLDLCGSTLCSDVASVQAWVTSALDRGAEGDGAACDDRAKW